MGYNIIASHSDKILNNLHQKAIFAVLDIIRWNVFENFRFSMIFWTTLTVYIIKRPTNTIRKSIHLSSQIFLSHYRESKGKAFEYTMKQQTLLTFFCTFTQPFMIRSRVTWDDFGIYGKILRLKKIDNKKKREKPKKRQWQRWYY